MYLNPAATGTSNFTNITAIYRTQWTGYTGTFDQGGNPVTQVISASAPINKLNGGLGLYISNDVIGANSISREVMGSYSYHKRSGPNLYAIGVAAGMHTRIIDGTKYRPREEDDNAIPNSRVSQSLPDVSVGVFLTNPAYQLGLSVKHLTEPAFGFNTLEGKNPLARNINVHGSLLLGLSYTLDISPMFVIKSDFNTVSPEIGALISYNSNLWAGLNYRWQDAASFLIGGNFLNNKLKAGYALDYVVFGTPAKAPLSHEILVSYNLAPPRSGKKSIIRTPRYRY